MIRKTVWLYIFAAIFLWQCGSLQKNQSTVKNTRQPQKPPLSAEDSIPIPVDPEVKIGKLPNGMTYYIRRNKKPEKKVEMRLAVNVGSIVEDDDQQGLAHFMEHMNFNGLKHFPKNELVHFLQRMGVRFGPDLNAYTSFDETVYILPIPLDDPSNLDKGLLVLHDWAYFANLDSSEIEKERGVVLEEYRLGTGAEQRMWNKTYPVLLKGSRYAERLPIGKKEILETFPHEALKRFHRDWYRPDLEGVMIVGDIDPDTVEAKLRKMFADIPAPVNPRERKYYPVPNHPETLVSVADDPEAADNSVFIYYKDRKDYRKPSTLADYKNYLKGKLITTMINNRLKDISEQSDPPFSYGFANRGLTWTRTKEDFTVGATVDPHKRLDALEVLLTETKKIKEFGFGQDELERAKREMIAKIEEAYNNRSTTHSRNYVWQYVKHFLKGESIPPVEWEYQMHRKLLPEITLEDVNQTAREWIHDDNRVIVVHGKRAPDITPVTEGDVRKILAKVDALQLEQKQEESARKSLMTRKPEPGKIIKTETDEILGTRTYYLNNGAVVTVKKTDFKEDEILFGAFKHGGKSLLDDGTLQKTGWGFMGVTQTGVNGLKPKELRKILAGKKAKIEFNVQDAAQHEKGNTLKKDMETAMQLNYLYFTALNKDPEAFESWRKRTGAYYGNFMNMPMVRFQRAYFDYLYKDDPRYTGLFPTPDVLAKVDYDLTYQKFRELYDGGTGFHFYVVGNVPEEEIRSWIETYVGGLPRSQTPAVYKDHGYHLLKGHNEFVYRAGKDPKSMVIITYYDEAPFSYEDQIKLNVLAKILSNKLIDKLREEESGVYGVGAYASMEKLPHSQYMFFIMFPCGPENARRLKDMAEAELHTLITEGPTEDDMKKVTKSLLVKFDEDIKTNQFWRDYLRDTDYLGLDPHRVNAYKDFIGSLTPEDIRKIAEKYLKNPRNKLTGYLYPEEKKESEKNK